MRTVSDRAKFEVDRALSDLRVAGACLSDQEVYRDVTRIFQVVEHEITRAINDVQKVAAAVHQSTRSVVNASKDNGVWEEVADDPESGEASEDDDYDQESSEGEPEPSDAESLGSQDSTRSEEESDDYESDESSSSEGEVVRKRRRLRR